MISIITGDIINSRLLTNQDIWIKPLKIYLEAIGKTPKNWELFRGDYFQLEVLEPTESLKVALIIKSIIKGIDTSNNINRNNKLDVRMAIGIGSKSFNAKRISESNGDAYVFSGEKFEMLKKEKRTLAIKTQFDDLNNEMNIIFKLLSIQMDKWTISSSRLIETILKFPNKTQAEIGKILGIEQNSVSGRMKRANAHEVLEVEKYYKEKINKYFNDNTN